MIGPRAMCKRKISEGLGPANSKWIIGNSIGPKLVRASQFKMDENGVFSMPLTLKVNGQERSRSNYETIYHIHPGTGKKQAWSFPRIMSWLGQQNIAIHPGYIIGSGTVGNGCIAEFMAKVDRKTNTEIEPATHPWLKDGDLVTMEAEGIGTLENKVKMTADALAKQYASIK